MLPSRFPEIPVYESSNQQIQRWLLYGIGRMFQSDFRDVLLTLGAGDVYKVGEQTLEALVGAG